ncbi:hypothetical protein B0T09DRAFT_66158 [Sordaria sp. MPI-SDFR-AT-0083]|nr:hypothetical protein B0T09DRAFT_66158 [Sordaria sp. MPI-SDFR-AT-0083]
MVSAGLGRRSTPGFHWILFLCIGQRFTALTAQAPSFSMIGIRHCFGPRHNSFPESQQKQRKTENFHLVSGQAPVSAFGADSPHKTCWCLCVMPSS